MTLGQVYFLLSATKGSFKQYSIDFLKIRFSLILMQEKNMIVAKIINKFE